MTGKFDLCHEYPLFSELSAEQMHTVSKLSRVCWRVSWIYGQGYREVTLI